MPNSQTTRSHHDETYKCLGILQLDSLKHRQAKHVIYKEYIQRVRKLQETTLNAGNTIKAIHSWATPVI